MWTLSGQAGKPSASQQTDEQDAIESIFQHIVKQADELCEACPHNFKKVIKTRPKLDLGHQTLTLFLLGTFPDFSNLYSQIYMDK